ncbi:PREDICTED: glutathione S-transferase-like [Dufourea novaeangliae]|uniref:glutathione transferase n=1 Tax=Dufourea novaeangliae TaxID=178035 RepID=A0A154PD67_DUFNO|nr:PREDICTED: glutathione S-transferase-like [Dufourea novaeangliae]KZC09846.1 Glutathione S-transferase [Dufourea novaeangliae]
MPIYKLTYFNGTGLAEPIRFLLHQSGIEFEDNRVTPEEWTKLKAGMPLGQLPVLEIDGKIYNQSRAIARLIAKKNNLYSTNDEEAYLIDATVDTIDDLRVAFSQYAFEQNPTTKEKLKETAFAKLPVVLNKLEEQVKKNSGFLVGGKLTWPDLLYTAIAERLSIVVEHDVNEERPELKKLVEKVKALPKIKAYLEKRPKTEW